MSGHQPDYPCTGLTTRQVAKRVAAGHSNRVQLDNSRRTADIIKANVVTRFNALLAIFLVVIVVVVDQPRDGLFGIVLVANTLIGIVQELRAKATLDRLVVLTAPSIEVIRDGHRSAIDVADVVLDDLVILNVGDQIPVDGEIVISNGLEIDESLLTGESVPVTKAAGDGAISGSFVVAGAGTCVATKVGEDAYAVTLARQAKEFTKVRSELRDCTESILRAISWVVGPIVALIVWSQVRTAPDLTEALRAAVAGAVGMIPQGLVLLTSMAFAVGVIRLGRRHVLVQELPAIEGLARVDTVCFDKTGTLTEGMLRVLETVPLTNIDPTHPLGALGKIESSPNATLRAVATEFAAPDWTSTTVIPFSSNRKWSGAEFEGHGTWLLGAPDVLAGNDPKTNARSAELASQGNRVLLLMKTESPLSGDSLPTDREPVSLVVLGDSVRPQAKETLQYFAQQGVQAKVISGDHPATVAAVAFQVGIPSPHNVVDGRGLPEDPESLAETMERNSVFGRVSPHQKRLMVKALQARGHVVAMTGDGVNDVLALKDADIGIAIGTGSSAARAVAQLVLVDGSFSSLPGVVDEGRRVISNVELVANLFITKTIYAIFIALATSLALHPYPLLPRHFTFVGSLTIGIPAFFLALAPSTKVARPGLLKRVLRFAVPMGLVAGLSTVAAYELTLSDVGLGDLVPARTLATMVLTAIGLLTLAIVSRPVVGWRLGLITTTSALAGLTMVLPAAQEFFVLDPPRRVLLVAGVGIISIAWLVMLGTLRVMKQIAPGAAT